MKRALVLSLLVATGCEHHKFHEPVTLGAKQVDAHTLNVGWEAYTLYCRACHGDNGDGLGPASARLRPPPRDFRIATYKFTGVIDGMPRDEDLASIIRSGLTGTAMLPWDVPDAEMMPLIQYLKTFSPAGEGWRDPDVELGRRVKPAADPWTNQDEAIARGSVIYHAKATCWSCHPAYATPQEIYAASALLVKEGARPSPITQTREGVYQPEVKESLTYVHLGVKQRFLPPDFLFNPIRTVNTRQSETEQREALFAILGAGIPGTAMPAWYGALPEKDLWAMVYYVKSLADLRDTARAQELRAKLAAAPQQVATGGN